MPLAKRDAEKEDAILEELSRDPEVQKALEEYEANIRFRRMLNRARRKETITQAELSERTGLSQQAISRIETGSGNTTLNTLMKYLLGIGYALEVRKIGEDDGR